MGIDAFAPRPRCRLNDSKPDGTRPLALLISALTVPRRLRGELLHWGAQVRHHPGAFCAIASRKGAKSRNHPPVGDAKFSKIPETSLFLARFFLESAKTPVCARSGARFRRPRALWRARIERECVRACVGTRFALHFFRKSPRRTRRRASILHIIPIARATSRPKQPQNALPRARRRTAAPLIEARFIRPPGYHSRPATCVEIVP